MAEARQDAYCDISVSKIFSSRLGGSIFSGTQIEPASRASMRVVAPAKAIRAGQPELGDVWRVVGVWEQDKRYGWQLRATRAYLVRPAARLVLAFLSDRAPRIDGQRAERLQAQLGEKLRDLLANGDIFALAAAVTWLPPALSLREAVNLVLGWQSAVAHTDLAAWLDKSGLDGALLARRAIEIFGHAARQRLQRNPYLLGCVAGSWPATDTFAWSVLAAEGCRDPRYDRRRLAGAVDFTAKSLLSSDGSTILSDASLRAGISRCLRLKPGSAAVNDAMHLAEKNGSLIALASGEWRTSGCMLLEDTLTERFGKIAVSDRPGALAIPDVRALGSLMDRGPHRVRSLGPELRAVVCGCMAMPLVTLVEEPEANSPDVIVAIRYLWLACGGRCECCAGSPQSSARFSNETGIEATALFELLAALERGSDGECAPGLPGSKHFLDARTLLLVGDSSTVPLGLWHRLAEAIPQGCRLLMVGDPNQSPPPGFGLFFHLLARNDAIFLTLPRRLKKPRSGSGVACATAVINGIAPTPGGFRGLMDGVFFESTSRSEIPSVIARVVTALGGLHADNSIQIAAPTAKGLSGADQLNAQFHVAHCEKSGAYRPLVADELQDRLVRGHSGIAFAAGEPVLTSHDDFARGIPAGTVGYIHSVHPGAQWAQVKFGNMLVVFGKDRLSDLSHAWCLSGHCVQAVKPDRMVVALYDDPRALDVSWIYTVLARTSRQVIFVGDWTAVERALRRPPAWRARKTPPAFLRLPARSH